MYRHNQVPIVVSHVLEADVAKDASIIDEDVNASIGCDGSLNDFVAVHDIVVVCNSLASRLDNFGNDLVSELRRFVSARSIFGSFAKRTVLALPSPWPEPPRSLTTTLAPREARNIAYAFPRPPPAPVTTATCPS